MGLVRPWVFVYIAKIATGGVRHATAGVPPRGGMQPVPGPAAVERMLTSSGSEALTEVGKTAIRVIGSYTSRQLLSDVLALSAAPSPAQMAVENSISAKVRARIAEISRQPGSGSAEANLLVAEREVLTRERAAEITGTSDFGTDVENWLKAEFEVITAQRARVIARSGISGGDLDNWLAAETEARIVLWAAQIGRSHPANGALDNWLAAKRDLGLA